MIVNTRSSQVIRSLTFQNLEMNMIVTWFSRPKIITLMPRYSQGVLAKKNHAKLDKNVESWNFQESCLGAHLIPRWKVPKNPSGGNFFLFKMAAIAIVAYCYTLKSCKFLNSCHRKTILGCIPMSCFERQKTQWNHYSNISLNPAGENPIWRPLQSEFHQRHQNVIQLVYRRIGFPWNPLKLYSRMNFSLPWPFH